MLRVFHPFSQPRLVFCSTWYCSISNFSIYKKKNQFQIFQYTKKIYFIFHFNFLSPLLRVFHPFPQPRLVSCSTRCCSISNFSIYKKKSISNFSVYKKKTFFFSFQFFIPIAKGFPSLFPSQDWYSAVFGAVVALSLPAAQTVPPDAVFCGAVAGGAGPPEGLIAPPEVLRQLFAGNLL